MVTSSKILTVTYGTFSCTLEGFDDPFTTLQMVAEYFRKLAAEDRYFGGVPQVPDTDTLKRIAEENNPKGIAAEIGENGITLRQSDEATEATAEMPEATAEMEAETDTPAVASAAPDAPDAGADVEQRDASPLTFFSSRRNEPVEAPAPEAAETEEAEEDVAAEVPLVARAETAEATDVENTPPAAADDPASAAVAVAEVGSARPPQQPAGQDSVSAALAAIRKTVETAENNIDENNIDSETRPADMPEAAPEAADDTESVADAVELPTESQPLVLNEADAVAPDTAEHVAEHVEVSAEEAEMKEAGGERTETAPETASETAPEFQAEEPLVEASAGEVAPQAEAEAQPEEPQPEEPQVSSLSEEEEAELARDLAAAFAEPAEAASGDIAKPASQDDRQAAPGDSTDDRAEPAQEAPVASPVTTTADDQPDRPENSRAETLATDVEPALNRLLEATQTKMDRPERARRMNALDQLKAAIAAIEAEEQDPKTVGGFNANQARDEATDLAAYREDLRRAQTPARGKARAGASAPVTPAPLILVSEQRIDSPDANTPETEVAHAAMEDSAQSAGNLALKPQPVASEEGTTTADSEAIQGIPADAFADATSFSDFAERIGAFDLTDLLEAAAAYTSIVEDKPRFSRAQVMSKIAKLNHGDSYSKEAGLRAFGKLLREGKILRVQDGQFGISEASRFSIATRYNEE